MATDRSGHQGSASPIQSNSPSPSTSPSRTLTIFESRPGNFPIIQDYIQAAKRRGWELCTLSHINSDQIARCDFANLPLDHVIYRGLDNNYPEIQRLLHWLKAHHKITMNTYAQGGLMTCSDKHQQQGLFLSDPFLKQYALPTFEAKHYRNVMSYLDGGRLHFPIVLKPRAGSTGSGIILVQNAAELQQVPNFHGLLIEQYIPPTCDFRVFTIGGVAVGIMRKTGDPEHPDDFEAWSGGRHRTIVTDPAQTDLLSEIATRAASVTHTEFGGVDILQAATSGELYLLENNIAAGWMNFLPITDIDLPGLVLDWFTDMADGRAQPFAVAVETYLRHWQKFLPVRIQQTLQAIAQGVPDALDPYRAIFATYPDRYLYDAGYLFRQFAGAYHRVTTSDATPEITSLLDQIEAIPLSWAGNFLGPSVGTFHDGAILSALYLYLRHYSPSSQNRQSML